MEKQIIVNFLKEIEKKIKMVNRGLKAENETHSELVGMYDGIKLAIKTINPDNVIIDLHYTKTIIENYFLGTETQKADALEALQLALSVAKD
ncbi:hypothetical protein EfsSzw1_188 [Enterococcus phage EfsSzw-1]|uniref:Uncharacterized protein n=1 Tax=Enterococcus phage EfsSzw-1 TaxID=2419745 RepID=A0A411B7X4_9CAUD|nr:hypothetical protein EfsSzw1_188 [Enterococcus phage EfsSzw-1]